MNSSAPLQQRNIKDASLWFEKLLIDNDGVVFIEIGQLLGMRVYRKKDLDKYNRLRKEIAAKETRKKAQELTDALDKACQKGKQAAASSKGPKLVADGKSQVGAATPAEEELVRETSAPRRRLSRLGKVSRAVRSPASAIQLPATRTTNGALNWRSSQVTRATVPRSTWLAEDRRKRTETSCEGREGEFGV